MSDVWIVILVLCAATAAIKGAGPLAVGGRELPRPLLSVIAMLAPALLAALVVVETFATEQGDPTLDARAAGLGAAAAILTVRPRALLPAVVAAAASAALVRALT